MVGPGADAALLRLAGPGLPRSERGVAVTTDSNPRLCALDPRRGTALVLAEGVANLACVGATAVAVVNCLNFGNPEHPEVMWQLSECIDGMAQACRALDLPVIGGNVSLYNESGGADIDPTPVLGLLGLVDAVRVRPPGLAWSAGDAIVVLGPPLPADASLEGTRWAAERRDHRGGTVPALDFAVHDAACRLVAGLVATQVGGAAGPLRAVHDVSSGGLAVALAEMAAAAAWGARSTCPGRPSLFAEAPSRSSWPATIPMRCAPWLRRPGSRRPCSAGPVATAWSWAIWSICRWTPYRTPTRAACNAAGRNLMAHACATMVTP